MTLFGEYEIDRMEKMHLEGVDRLPRTCARASVHHRGYLPRYLYYGKTELQNYLFMT